MTICVYRKGPGRWAVYPRSARGPLRLQPQGSGQIQNPLALVASAIADKIVARITIFLLHSCRQALHMHEPVKERPAPTLRGDLKPYMVPKQHIDAEFRRSE